MKYLLIVYLSFIGVMGQYSQVEDVAKKINLDNQGYIDISQEVKFKPGQGVTSYFHVVPIDYKDQVVEIKAVRMTDFQPLSVKKLSGPPSLSQFENINLVQASNLIFYQIDLGDIRNKKVVVIEVTEVYKRRVEPFPSTIQLKEDQYVKLEDSKYVLSVYTVAKQKTTLFLDTRTMVTITEDPTLDKKSQQVSYGPYKDVAPLKYEYFRVHYQKNTPMPIFTESWRQIEISHWGNINVEEHFELFNLAAGIKGEFGRIDYNQYNPSDGKSALKSLTTDLPRYIRGLYYYDFIGNISTSNAFRDADKVKFHIEPRYPVFGQWKTDWNQGYNIPTRYHLFYDTQKPGRFIFNFTFMHDYKDFVSENYTVKVILPEGATNIKVHTPFPMDSEERSLHFSTLDYIGRPVVVLKKNNALVALHEAYFQVSYTFENQMLFIEAIYLIVFLFVLFMFAIVYSRFDMHFDEKKNVKHE